MSTAPAFVHPLDGAVHGVLEDLRTHELEMTRLFPVGIDILDAALQMLARNGVVQAGQMNRAGRGGHGQGAPGWT